MWIQYDTDKPTMQWKNSEADAKGNYEIIQSYGNDARYPAFQAKIDSGEITPIKFEDTDGYKLAMIKHQEALDAFAAQ